MFGEPGGRRGRVPPRHPARGRGAAPGTPPAGGDPARRGGGLAGGRHAARRRRRRAVARSATTASGSSTRSATDERPVYVVGERRRAATSSTATASSGAAGDDPLDRRAERSLGADELADAHRRVAGLRPRSGHHSPVPTRPERLRSSRPRASPAAWLLCLSLPPFGFWPLAVVGLVVLDRLIADQPARVRFRRGWLVAMGCFVPVARLDDRAHRAGLRRSPARPTRGCSAPASRPLRPGAGAGWPSPARGRSPSCCAGRGPSAACRSPTSPSARWPGPLAAVLRVGGSLLLVLVHGAGRPGRRRRGPAGAWRPRPVALALGRPAGRAVGGGPAGHAVGTRRGRARAGRRASRAPARPTTSVIEVFERHVEATDLVEPPVDLVVWPEDVIDTDGPFVDDPWADVVGELAARARRADDRRHGRGRRARALPQRGGARRRRRAR